jgi:2-dehydro-3-deoxyphosphogluconate aldolase / (4S)-4-hydroxy-2-oxoglutarate aldolase
MSQHSRLDVLNTLLQTGLVPLFYHADAEIAGRVVEACAAGGARLVEFTNRGDFAFEVFAALRRQHPEMILGAGTITDAVTAALYLNNGADFIVSPAFYEDVARLCNRRKAAYLPGCATLTEISHAEEWGVEVVKLFPGSAFTPDFVKAIRAPSPQTRIMPTGGVQPTEESIHTWFDAGVSAVGIGSQLIAPTPDFAAIRERCVQVLGWIRGRRKTG